MKLKKWLKVIDPIGINCNIYIGEDLIYAGSMSDIPYWLVDYPISKYNDEEDQDSPIWFGHKIRKSTEDVEGTEGYNGFVISLNEKEY